MTPARLSEIKARCEAATKGPWTHKSYGSGTEYVHMRNASGKAGPSVFGPDRSDQDGHVGAHMFLHNVPAFEVMTGETEETLEHEKAANAIFIAHARVDLPDAIAEVERLTTENDRLRRDMGTIEQARVMTERALASAKTCNEMANEKIKERDAAKAEIERLRGLIGEIAKRPCHYNQKGDSCTCASCLARREIE